MHKRSLIRPIMSNVQRILLSSDSYSPMSAPHGLPALRWSSLANNIDADEVEARLRKGGWDPQWRFGMYKQAHYHSTTHELLVVIKGQAIIQLGGTDERAHPRNQSNERTTENIDLKEGDVLLLPAGYTHRAIECHSGFTMIGSYPQEAEHWDMRFPNVMGCPHDVEKISKLIKEAPRKGLFEGISPEKLLSKDDANKGDVDTAWLDL